MRQFPLKTRTTLYSEYCLPNRTWHFLEEYRCLRFQSATGFCPLTLHLVTLLNFLNSSRNYADNKFSIETVLFLPSQSLCSFISSSCDIIALARLSNMMLNRSDKSECLCLLPIFGGKQSFTPEYDFSCYLGVRVRVRVHASACVCV